ncbi:MAG: dTDP-4-dehydrorhamnose 3,5-epimerase [Deltaproteobacteria bacterium]|nr:dTDP-4-dehydrorhamnose 3,5-epimerase [Deltaproteobacteria bacterium]
MPFSFQPLDIPEVIVITPKIFPDERGYFKESFKGSDFQNVALPEHFVQDNISFSRQGVLRGLHYQKEPKAQGKLVSVISGTVWDVAVDMRPESSTFKRWVGIELNDDNHKMVYIPVGFAHGFLTLSKSAYFLYKCTNEYSPMHDAGIRWDDPEIAISWNVKNPILSPKDAALPRLSDVLEEL